VFRRWKLRSLKAFGKHLTGLGKKVAVLAVDQAVPFHGSILGDKTRMDELVKRKRIHSSLCFWRYWVV
jgi:LAO/AO transport system kinase